MPIVQCGQKRVNKDVISTRILTDLRIKKNLYQLARSRFVPPHNYVSKGSSAGAQADMNYDCMYLLRYSHN